MARESSLTGDESYRAFTAAWTAHPTDKPAVAARVNAAGPYFAVKALDAGNHVPGRSPTVRVSS